MKVIKLFLAAISCLMIGASPQNPVKQCIDSLPDDSINFGSSVAINNKYLAVGDPTANYVVIYTRDNSGKWLRTQEISPPINSIPDQVGRGFGSNLQLDGDVLAISAFTWELIPDRVNLKTFYRRYLIGLNSETEVKAIDLPVEKKHGLVQFNLLSQGEIKQVTLPDNGERGFGEDNGLGYNFAFDSNLLLVGSPSYPTGGGAWLFDLNQPESKPLKLTAPNIYIGESVALSEQFAAVSDLFGDTVHDVPPLPPKTLIRAINNGSTTVIDSYGELSLSGNILAVMRLPSPDNETTALLEVFRLDNNAKPDLIIKREHPIERAWVQNGFLVTVQRHYFYDLRPSKRIQLCIESVH